MTTNAERAMALAREVAIAIVTHSQGRSILQRFLTWILNEGPGPGTAAYTHDVMLAQKKRPLRVLRRGRRAMGTNPWRGMREAYDTRSWSTTRLAP